jgi:hypothetical protein
MCRWFHGSGNCDREPSDLGLYMHRRFRVPQGQAYDGLAKGGDTLALEMVCNLQCRCARSALS